MTENRQLAIGDQLIQLTDDKPDQKKKGTVVLLHGWRSNKEAWTNIKRRLADDGWRVLALDLPGFGQSPNPKTPWSVSDYAAVVAAVLAKLEVNECILIGHSFGGRIGIKLAAEKPELIQKLILVDAAGVKSPEKGSALTKSVASLVKPLFTPAFMKPLRKRIYKALGAEDYVATPALRETFLNVIGENLTSYLPHIVAPSLIIWGEQDSETPVKQAHIMEHYIPHAKLVVIPNAGHFSFIDQPNMFYQSLTEFLTHS